MGGEALPSLPSGILNFDIDKKLSPIVPRSRINRLPQPLSHFLGYRKHGPKHVANLWVWVWSGIGAFCGVALLEGCFKSSKIFQEKDVPLLIGSYAASAILLFGAIESPLGQPRNCFVGHLLASIIGVCITKLCALGGPERYEDLRWLAGALSCGVASFVMGLTKTIHPPAGATAALAAVEPAISALGWYYIPVVILSSVLMICAALIINNIQRRYPAYWWTPKSVSKPPVVPETSEKKDVDEDLPESDMPQVTTPADAATTPVAANGGISRDSRSVDVWGGSAIIISKFGIHVPPDIDLAEEEEEILQILKNRILQVQNDSSSERTANGGNISEV